MNFVQKKFSWKSFNFEINSTNLKMFRSEISEKVTDLPHERLTLLEY